MEASPDPPNGQGRDSRYGWLSYRRVKTNEQFYRPMSRVVRTHLKSLRPDEFLPEQPVFHCGSSRPNEQFQRLCTLAGVKPKRDIETGDEKSWVLKDLRKTCATYYDAHMPESSIEILGHSVGGVTYRHYAHCDPLAFKAIMSRSQPHLTRSCMDSMVSVRAVGASSFRRSSSRGGISAQTRGHARPPCAASPGSEVSRGGFLQNGLVEFRIGQQTF